MSEMPEDIQYRHEKDHSAVVLAAVKLLRSMEEDERMEVFGEFCTQCGANNPRCQCWNDA